MRLTRRLESETDLRDALASFNAAHPDHAPGLFLEGAQRLDKGEREGLALLDRAMAKDPEATKPACERAHAFLVERKETEAAQDYAQRWRQRDELETQRDWQIRHVEGTDRLVSHGLDAETLRVMKARLAGPASDHVAGLLLARRVIPADPTVVQFLLSVELTWWGRRRGKQQEVVNRLATVKWPIQVVVLTLEGRYADLKKTLRGLPDARLL